MDNRDSAAGLGPEAVPICAADVLDAARRIAPYVHRTPILESNAIDNRCQGSVYLKCENFQKAGAFKMRGALNAMLCLSDAERRGGVITHSSGNHGQALALAGKLLHVPVTVVMPRTSLAVKRQATEGYGARVVLCEPTLAAREAAVSEEIARNGQVLVHPFNDWNVMAGQGTAALELLEQAGPFDVVLCPVGGGGLISGTAVIVKARAPATRTIGVEPALADDARRSLEAGSIQPSNDPMTIADGLRTTLGPRPFAVISRYVPQIVTATEREILEATRFIWERLKIIIEPSSAVPVAALWNGQLEVRGMRIGIILSGGNADLGPVFQALEASIG